MESEYYNHNKEIFDIHLVICGKEKCVPEFKMPPHLREYYLIHYIQSGSVIFCENEREHVVKQGDIFVIYPENLTKYHNADMNIPLEFCWVGFVGDGSEKYLEYAGMSRDNPVIHLNNSAFENETLKLVKLFEKEGCPSEIALNNKLLKCFSSIEKSMKTGVKESVNYVDSALAYIEDNFMKGISSVDVADFVNLNRSYLFKIFKQQTGLSVSQYLIKYRMNKACGFFREYDFTVSEVAQMVGISDIYYFSKLFKKFMEISPTEYKKRQDS